jgi:RNA polymerase sigma-70 factor (ECF subfamily)
MLRPPSITLADGAFLEIETAQDQDLELARKARNGDEQAFEEIVKRYTPRVFHIASRFFRQRSVVEEVSQEVFLRAYTQMGSYEGRGSLEGWVSRIATNLCLNLLRKSSHGRELSLTDLSREEGEWIENRMEISHQPGQSPIERAVVASDLADRLLCTLPADDRMVLMLLDGEQLSVKQIKEMTGWSESKIKVKALRARAKMRKAVEKLLGSRGER